MIRKTEFIFSQLIKVLIFVCAILGTVLSAYAGRNSFMGGTYVFMFFTIQSNIGIAIICLFGFLFGLKNKSANRIGQIIKFVGTVSITLTGVVFCAVLAPTMGKSAWGITNVLTHVVVPVLSIVDFFIVAKNYEYKKLDSLWVTIPPLCYAIYAGIGFVRNWQFSEGINYPYFFLNWGSAAGAFGFSKELPFIGCGWWILILLIFLIGVGLGYLKIVDLIKNKK